MCRWGVSMGLSVGMPHIGYDLRTFRGDVFGGITAAVVGLPVALAFGVASGLGPLAGIYGAVAVGFFAAVFGGTRSQISGPTGPMSVAMAAIVTVHSDNLADAFFIVILAGLLQILLGALRIGRLVAFTPHSVISGFMSGIGLIIIVLQVLPFLGSGSADGGPLGAVRAIPDAVAGVNYDAFVIAVVTLAVGVLFPARIGRWFPPTLAALLAGTLLGVLWLDGAPVIGEVPTGIPEVVLPSVDAGLLLNAVVPALTLALLGSIDSLLTSLIVDAKSRAVHNPDKELVGQGIANTVAGLIGALPGAGNTLSTLVNFQAGGRTAVAGVLVAVILVAMAVGLGDFVESVPHAALAGILVKVGWDILDKRFLARAHQVQRENLLVMLGTMAMTVILDLITAVMVGLIAAGIASTRQFVPAGDGQRGLDAAAGPGVPGARRPGRRRVLGAGGDGVAAGDVHRGVVASVGEHDQRRHTGPRGADHGLHGDGLHGRQRSDGRGAAHRAGKRGANPVHHHGAGGASGGQSPCVERAGPRSRRPLRVDPGRGAGAGAADTVR